MGCLCIAGVGDGIWCMDIVMRRKVLVTVMLYRYKSKRHSECEILRQWNEYTQSTIGINQSNR